MLREENEPELVGNNARREGLHILIIDPLPEPDPSFTPSSPLALTLIFAESKRRVTTTGHSYSEWQRGHLGRVSDGGARKFKSLL